MMTELAFLGELNKGASKGYSSDAIEKPFLIPQRTIQLKVI